MVSFEFLSVYGPNPGFRLPGPEKAWEVVEPDKLLEEVAAETHPLARFFGTG